MIKIKSDLHGIEETITRPILIQIVSDVKTLLGLKSDIPTIYDPKDSIIKQRNESGEVVGRNTITSDKIWVEYEENSEDLAGISLVPARPDFKPIYKDDDIGASFVPIYHSRKFTIQFRYFNKSRSKVFSIVNKLKLLPSSDSFDRLHDLQYSYLLPNFLSKLLMEINTLKNTRIPDGEKLSLEQYIDNTFDDRIDFANTLDGDITKCELAIREKQIDIEGYIADDIDGLKPEYDDDTGSWSIDFSYELQYEKPVTLLITYPILVYNNVIDKFFRTFNDVKLKRDMREIRTARAQDMYNVTQREQDRDDIIYLSHPNDYLKLPDFDNYNLPNSRNKYLRLCSILTQVDEIDQNLLFNLKEIPKVQFKDVYYNYLLTNRDNINKEYETILLFELYKEDKKDYTTKILLSDDGTLTTNIPLDFKHTYRVTISLLLDPDSLTAKHKDLLKTIVKQQILDPGKKIEGTSIKQFKKYYQLLNYQHMYWNRVYNKINADNKYDGNYVTALDKFGEIINYGNILVDWYTVLQPDPTIVDKIIKDSKKFTDILDYTLSDKTNGLNFTSFTGDRAYFKTVQVSYAITSLFDRR